MAEYQGERPPPSTDGGSGGVIAVLVVIVILLVAGFLYFTRYGDEMDEGPDIELNLPAPEGVPEPEGGTAEEPAPEGGQQ